MLNYLDTIDNKKTIELLENLNAKNIAGKYGFSEIFIASPYSPPETGMLILVIINNLPDVNKGVNLRSEIEEIAKKEHNIDFDIRVKDKIALEEALEESDEETKPYIQEVLDSLIPLTSENINFIKSSGSLNNALEAKLVQDNPYPTEEAQVNSDHQVAATMTMEDLKFQLFATQQHLSLYQEAVREKLGSKEEENIERMVQEKIESQAKRPRTSPQNSSGSSIDNRSGRGIA